MSRHSIVLVLAAGAFAARASASDCRRELLERAGQYIENPARVLAAGLEKSFQYVRVDRRRIGVIARQASRLGLELGTPPWSWPPYLERSQDFEQVFDFFLTVNAINYKYFETGSEREFSDGGVHEATLAATRIAQNWERLSEREFERLRTADEAFLAEELFKAEVPMPMLGQRVLALRELGHFLRDFRGRGHGWAETLRQMPNPAAFAYALPWVLPTWRDPFLKRSQLQMFMSLGRASALGVELFEPGSEDELTVAADYMLPRVLYAMGAIEYRSEDTLRAIRERRLIGSGTRLEMEIRAATVQATEALKEAMERTGRWSSVTAPGVDALLWTIATGNFPDEALLREIRRTLFKRDLPPFHHTETTDY